MSAISVFKNLRLEDDIRSLLSTSHAGSDIYCSDFKGLVTSSKCFTSDLYSLPSGIDSRICDVYPMLQDLKRHSSGLSRREIEKMAAELRAPPHLPTIDESAPVELDPVFATPAYGFDPACTSGLNNDNEIYTSVNYNAPSGFDFDLSANNFSNGLFEHTSKSRGYACASARRSASRTFADDVDTVADDFNLDEFKTAFQPGNDYRTEYTCVETPPREDRLSNRNEVAVSPGTWDKSGFDYPRCGINTATSSIYRPTSKSMDAYSKFDFGSPPAGGIWVDSRIPSAYSPARMSKQPSPLRSIANDSDNSYGKVFGKTPTRPFYDDDTF